MMTREEIIRNKANLGGANLGGANLRGTNLVDANLNGANLGGADLVDANLGGANLRGANLSGADLKGADLRYANLSGVHLIGAKFDVDPIFIEGSSYKVQIIGKEVRIGCEVHELVHWLEHYREIALKHNFTEAKIDEYYGYIKQIKGRIK